MYPVCACTNGILGQPYLSSVSFNQPAKEAKRLLSQPHQRQWKLCKSRTYRYLNKGRKEGRAKGITTMMKLGLWLASTPSNMATKVRWRSFWESGVRFIRGNCKKHQGWTGEVDQGWQNIWWNSHQSKKERTSSFSSRGDWVRDKICPVPASIWLSCKFYIVIAAERGIVIHQDRPILKEYVGPVELKKSWAFSFLRRLGYVKCKGPQQPKSYQVTLKRSKQTFLGE